MLYISCTPHLKLIFIFLLSAILNSDKHLQMTKITLPQCMISCVDSNPFISVIAVIIMQRLRMTLDKDKELASRFRYPLYQLGNPQLRIFRPNWFLTLVRPGKEQPPDTVQFRIPME